MNKSGPVIIIEDDAEDREILNDAFRDLKYPNPVLFFNSGVEALVFLQKSGELPFLILSDINLPKLNGFEIRDKIHNNEDLRLKCTPYLFFTTSTDQQTVLNAYSRSIQGFFAKPTSHSEVMRILKNIMEYWKDCHPPNDVLPG